MQSDDDGNARREEGQKVYMLQTLPPDLGHAGSVSMGAGDLDSIPTNARNHAKIHAVTVTPLPANSQQQGV